MRLLYYGHFGVETGFGRAATDMALAWQRHGSGPLQIRCVGPYQGLPEKAVPLAPHLRSTIDLAENPRPDAVIVHTLPDRLAHTAYLVRSDLTAAGHNIEEIVLVALTAWEASLPDDMAASIRGARFKQIWVPSLRTARQMRQLDDTFSSLRMDGPLRVVPHTFDESVPTRIAQAPRSDGTYRFYWYGAWNHRKNPAGVIQAYAHAFRAGDPVELYLHSAGAPMEAYLEAMASTGLPQNELRIIVNTSPLTDDGIRSLHASNDCFVTAARGEAWNLPAFEAMLAGRHVIAPIGLGSDQYLLQTTADLYEAAPAVARLEMRATETPGGYALGGWSPPGLTSRCTWREPDLLDLASRMRKAYRNRTDSIVINYAAADIFGYEAVVRTMTRNLQEIVP